MRNKWKLDDNPHLFGMGKLPPQATELEEGILGAIMIERGAYDTAAKFIQEADCFYKEAHQRIWKAFAVLSAATEPIDLFTVTTQLRKMGELEVCGGAHYVTMLTTRVNSSANLETWCLILKQMWMKREMVRIGQKLASQAYEDTSDAHDLLLDLQKDVERLTGSARVSQHVELGNVAMEIITDVDKRVTEGKKAIDHLTTGIPQFDAALGGIRKGQPDLIVLAARPAMGKSAEVAIMIRENALAGVPVGLWSGEMSARQYVQRMIISGTGGALSQYQLENTILNRNQFEALSLGAGPLMPLKIPIHDQSIEINELVALAKQWKLEYDIQLLLLDYLQLIRVNGARTRNEEVGTISRSLKALAKKLSIPIIAISSLNREVDKRESKIPLLSDLRDSGDVEYDIDMVWFLYREFYYNPGNLAAKNDILHVIAKNRNGPMAEIQAKIDLASIRNLPDLWIPPANPPVSVSLPRIELPPGFNPIDRFEGNRNEVDEPF